MTLVDNIEILAIENCLLHPLAKLLTAEDIHDLDDRQLAQIASETQTQIEHRNKLKEELKQLQTGLDALSKLAKSCGSSPPSHDSQALDPSSAPKTFKSSRNSKRSFSDFETNNPA